MGDAALPRTNISESDQTPELPTKIYAISEIAQHDKIDDLWIIVDSNVYDITSFVNEHPGGAKILQSVAGKDATRKFQKYHRPAILKRYEERLKIGQIEPEQTVKKRSRFRLFKLQN